MHWLVLAVTIGWRDLGNISFPSDRCLNCVGGNRLRHHCAILAVPCRVVQQTRCGEKKGRGDVSAQVFTTTSFYGKCKDLFWRSQNFQPYENCNVFRKTFLQTLRALTKKTVSTTNVEKKLGFLNCQYVFLINITWFMRNSFFLLKNEVISRKINFLFRKKSACFKDTHVK